MLRILVSGMGRFLVVSTAADEAVLEHCSAVRGHEKAEKEAETVVEPADVPKSLPVIVPTP